MKKITLLLALLFVSFTNAQDWNDNRVEGNGNNKTITKTTSDYDEIIVGGSYTVDLIAGKEGTITINGDENIIEHMKVEVIAGKLKVFLDRSKSFRFNSKLTITIPFEKISNVTFSGSGSIKTKNKMVQEELILTLNGSGKANFDVECNSLKAELAGSGNLNISGTTTKFETELSGSGNIDCSDLTSQNAKASLAGSGKIKLNCTKSLDGNLIGSGKILYSGNPGNINKDVSGSGKIISY